MHSLSGIHLMEDHNEALEVWKQNGIRSRILVHVDAHMDVGSIPQKDPYEILEASNISEVNRLLEEEQNWNLTKKDFYSLVNIGNYIYPAIRDGLVKEFWWVVPDRNLKKTGKHILKYLKKMAKKDSNYAKEVSFSDGSVRGQLFNIALNICNIDTLPEFKEEILLDIDCDYFVYKSARQHIFSNILEKRRPWIEPEEFVDKLKRKNMKTDLITIANSVEGGFTPIEYKYLGYELKELCGKLLFDDYKPGERKENAGLYFNLSITEWEKGNLSRARDLYKKALQLDSTYRSYFNNRGFLYEEFGLLDKAFSEYEKILSLDPECPYNNVNMGRLLIKKGRLDEALSYLKKGIELNQDDFRAYSLLGDIHFKRKEFEKAIVLYKESLNLESEGVSALKNLGICYWKKQNMDKARKRLRKAVRLDPFQLKIRFLLIHIYVRKNLFYRAKREIVNCFKILPVYTKINFFQGLRRLYSKLPQRSQG